MKSAFTPPERGRTMQTEQIHQFHERLNQWVANQGFWFQVRYSMFSSQLGGKTTYHVLRLFLRVLVFLLLVSVGVGIYLFKRTDSQPFREELRASLQSALHAKQLEFGMNRQQSHLEITRLGAEGGPETFFSSLEARNIRCRMGLTDGLIGTWDPEVISIAKLTMGIRAGADDAHAAAQISKILFGKSTRIPIHTISINSAQFDWGFSAHNQGSIQSSQLTMQRTEAGWRLTFKGGTFSQNWLKNLTIREMIVLCEPSGLYFEKAELAHGQGTVDFSGTRVEPGERPKVHGQVRIQHIELENFLPASLHDILSGALSAQLQMSGSTNSSEGIGLDGLVVMDGSDTISLRDSIHLLKALSVVDYSRNYHRIDFNEGSFQMKTTRGGLELKDIRIQADDIVTLEGALTVRPPNDEEVKSAVAKGLLHAESLADLDSAATFSNELRMDITLRRAANVTKAKSEPSSPDALTLFDRLGLGVEMKKVQSEASQRLSRMLRYQGNLVITLPGDTFERAPKLQARYPAQSGTGKVAVGVPLDGYLDELTLEQAEQVYREGQR